MKRPIRLPGLGRLLRVELAVVVAALVVSGIPRSADAEGDFVEHQAWARTGPAAVTPPAPAADRLYVSLAAGSEAARSFVGFGSDAGVGGRSALVMDVAPDSLPLAGTVLVACLLTRPLTGDGELRGDAIPDADCSVETTGVPVGDHVEFDLAAFGAAWTGGAPPGVALVGRPAVPGATTTVAFDAAQTRVAVDPAPLPAPPAAPAPATPAAEPAPPVADPASPADAALGDDTALPFPSMASGVSTGQPAAGPSVPEPATSGTAPSDAVVAAGGEPGGLPTRPARSTGPVDRPATGWVLSGLALVLAAAFTALHLADRRWSAGSAPVAGHLLSRTAAVAALAAALTPLAVGSEGTVYKVGLVLIFSIAAMGLHILVNWAGELSLAHAAFVGLPALVAAKLSSDAGLSPLVLLPVAVAVGAALGGFAALPALRVQGLYVAIVTLGLGIAVDRFLFAQRWLVGPVGNLAVPPPRLGPLTFATSRQLYAVLVVVFLSVVVLVAAIGRSRIARAMRWGKANPDGARAAGINVTAYRVLAYLLAGGLAGLAGGLSTVWIQRVSAQSFPATESFTYLSVVVMAGAGSVAGVIGVSAVLEGTRLFVSAATGLVAYAGPVGLVLILTTLPQGVNGQGRKIMRRFHRPLRAVKPTGTMALGIACVVLGLAAILLAWYHTGNTRHVWIQIQEVASGGLGGLALVVLGTGLLVRDQLARNAVSVARPGDAAGNAVDVNVGPVTAGDTPSADGRRAGEPVPGVRLT